MDESFQRGVYELHGVFNSALTEGPRLVPILAAFASISPGTWPGFALEIIRISRRQCMIVKISRLELAWESWRCLM